MARGPLGTTLQRLLKVVVHEITFSPGSNIGCWSIQYWKACRL